MEEDSESVTTTTTSGSVLNPQHPQTSHTDHHTVQVIQQAVSRPAGVAQYLQQMYAAQQHHIMLQTLHQHHQTSSTTNTTCHSPTPAQGCQSNIRQTESPPPSANGSSAQTAVQSSSVSGSAGAISQQAVLLGNSSTPGSQAQMYLRTQMLILAPAATVAADLPALSSISSQPSSTQVPSLALRPHLPGALSAAQNIQLKASQGQTLVTPLPKMSICPLKSTQLSQALAETSRTFSPALRFSNQLHCPHSQKGPPPQFLLQSSVAQRQGQPITLRVTQDCSHPSLSLLTRTTPTQTAVLSKHCQAVSGPAPCDHLTNHSSAQPHSVVTSTSMLPPVVPVLPDPPPLHLGPVLDPLNQAQPLTTPPPPPPLTLGLSRLPVAPPPASVQRLSLHSVHALALQSDHMFLSEDELPAAEALAQLPFQNLPPPQTCAVDLKMQPNIHMEAPSTAQTLKEDGLHMDVDREEEQKSPDRSRTSTPPALTSTQELHHPIQTIPCSDSVETSSLQSSRSVIRSAEDPASTTSPWSSSLRPAVRSSRPARTHILTHLIEGFIITESLKPFPVEQRRKPVEKQQEERLEQECQENKEPQHQENEEPQHQENEEPQHQENEEPQHQENEEPQHQENEESQHQLNEEPQHQDLLMDTEQIENSSDSDVENTPVEDERQKVDLIQCEFCGRRSYTYTVLHSKHFCSMTCIRSFNISSVKRLAELRAHRVTRLPNRPLSRRGRPPRHISRVHREHLYRQLRGSYRVKDSSVQSREEECEDEDSPSPMTTRLRLQAERERQQEERERQQEERERQQEERERQQEERERQQEERERQDCSSSTSLLDSSPAVWSVEQVCSYISSLPGCQEMVSEFRSQEIDGQALLLLTEEHLMSAMNIKLGPALKICAQINSLKQQTSHTNFNFHLRSNS